MEAEQYARELHRPAFKPSTYRKVVVAGLDDTFAIDLADMSNKGYQGARKVKGTGIPRALRELQDFTTAPALDKRVAKEYSYAKTKKPTVAKVEVIEKVKPKVPEIDPAKGWAPLNDGYSYIFVCIDVFSRYAWLVPLKDKRMESTWIAFDEIMKTSKRKPAKIWVDRGSEFYNQYWKPRLENLGITMYSTYGDHKSSIVERLNRTMKALMYKDMTARNSHRWVDSLPNMVRTYNNRKHSALNMTPVEASKRQNEVALWKHQYGDQKFERIDEPKFEIGDKVRISRIKGKFETGYDINFSMEVFLISGISFDEPVMYTLRDFAGEAIEGSFYENELQKTDWSLGDVTFIEKILAHRTVRGKRQSLVKWLGWPDKFNRWMADSELKDV